MTERRCDHGFMRSVVACPECGGAPAQDAPTAPEHRASVRGLITAAMAREALDSSEGVMAAAAKLGCTKTLLYAMQKRDPSIRDAYEHAAQRGIAAGASKRYKIASLWKRGKHITEEQIAEALAASRSISDAARRLGCSGTHVRNAVKKWPGLAKVYSEAAERGKVFHVGHRKKIRTAVRRHERTGT